MTQPGSVYYQQQDSEAAARQSQARGFAVQQARQQAGQRIEQVRADLDREYTEAVQAYERYEAQARDELAALGQQARAAAMRVQSPVVAAFGTQPVPPAAVTFPGGPPMPPGLPK